MFKDKKEYINFIVGDSKFINFNEKLNAFQIENFNLTWNELRSLNKVIYRMRHNKPPKNLFKTKISQINLGYYDRLLEDYCIDRLEKNLRIKETKLVSEGNKSFVVGRVSDDHEFSDQFKKSFLINLKNEVDPVLKLAFKSFQKNNNFIENLTKTDEGWIMCFMEEPIIYSVGLKSYFETLREKIKGFFGYYPEDRILDVIRNIRKNGWNTELTWKPHIGSNLTQGSIIGISNKTGSYSLITGRHRVTAAVYLFKNGELSPDLSFDYPRIYYPWKTWVYDNV